MQFAYFQKFSCVYSPTQTWCLVYQEPSKQVKGLKIHFVHAFTHRKTWALLQQRMQQAGCIIQLLPSSSDKALRTQSHSRQGHMRPVIVWEAKLITLSGHCNSFFFFSILHFQQVWFFFFFSHRLTNYIAHNKRKLPNSTAPLLNISLYAERQQTKT